MQTKTMKIKNLLFVLLPITLFACSESDHQSIKSDLAESSTSIDNNAESIKTNNINIPSNRKLIWEGNLELEVKDVDLATKNITDICNNQQAYISDMNLKNGNYQISNSITIKVKNENFNKLINQIKGNSINVKKLEISSNDVTEEYIDIESRLKTKKEVRDRYIEILHKNTSKIADVIDAEESIRVITEEIEAKEGRLRFLKDKVNYSTINILLFQDIDISVSQKSLEPPFYSEVLDAVKNGWSIITNVFIGLLNIWPIFILLIIGIWKRKWLKKVFGFK